MHFSDAHRMLASVVLNAQAGNETDYNRTFANLKRHMLGLMSRLDDVLGSNANYLLGAWTSSAERLATTPWEKANSLYNAKNQVTMWGPSGQINDYAAKGWSGLYTDYYMGRWSLFFDELEKIGPVNWDHDQWNNACLGFEEQWVNGSKQYSPLPTNPTKTPNLSRALLEYMTNSSVTKDYVVVANSDIMGYDYAYTPLWSLDVHQLALLCDLVISCRGFNSNGYLKMSGSAGMFPSEGTTFYRKKKS
jgi:alpha-N-acetylglucosaminidase